MLFANPPVNVSAAIAQTFFRIDGFIITSAVFSYGASRFAVGIRADGSDKCGIAESIDDGATWITKHQSYAGLVANPRDITAAVSGSTIYLAIMHVGGGALRVLTFDMAAGVYTSTSPDLTGGNFFNDGLGIANSIGDYYYISRQFDAILGSQVPMMHILSGGSWSTGVRLNANDARLAAGRACACVDSADDIHAYWTDTGVGVTEDLVYSKISGTSHTPSVLVKSGQTVAYDAICFGGKQYISWSASSSTEQWVIVGDSDTNPASWSDTQIDITNVGGSIQAVGASFVADGATLNLFYSARANGTSPHVQQIWYSQLVSGVWGAPISAFDASVNPPSAQAFATQFISEIDVCRTGAAAYACCMNAVNATGFTNVYFMSATGATGPTFAARYRARP